MGSDVDQEIEMARTFYDQQRERNKSHHAAVRALSFKWLPHTLPLLERPCSLR